MLSAEDNDGMEHGDTPNPAKSRGERNGSGRCKE
jgi:hypothetical protein